MAEPTVPEVEVLEGALNADGWTSRRLALRVPPASGARLLKAAIRNPTFNAAYLRNMVKVMLDGEEVFSEVLFAGQTVTLEQAVAARDELLLEVESEAFLVPDPLDQRERGVLLKLTVEEA